MRGTPGITGETRGDEALDDDPRERAARDVGYPAEAVVPTGDDSPAPARGRRNTEAGRGPGNLLLLPRTQRSSTTVSRGGGRGGDRPARGRGGEGGTPFVPSGDQSSASSGSSQGSRASCPSSPEDAAVVHEREVSGGGRGVDRPPRGRGGEGGTPFVPSGRQCSWRRLGHRGITTRESFEPSEVGIC
jgi:hypothetical protein